ncbi:AraC family transcriptional regulator [Geobacter sp. DSM 9736]|uniref:AraC family transcriptional regulator n=1 Tax=Geobacter sp. DSM 9736 TaxID=1277350 RepID=UPI000B507384|nr:AraC family transcriptional regulator [Geobacter sp. DSM 9736]SNB46962.1 two component transcriptional regulator, AraC family [Geobacter sp. DSM 9736]
MAQKPLIVIADEDEESFYRALPLWEERVEFHPLSRPFSFLHLPDPDLMLIDCGDNTAKGLDLLTQSKRERTDVPVILIAEPAEGGGDETAVAAYRLGARHFLEKPVGLFRLKETVEELLRIKRSSRERREPTAAGYGAAHQNPDMQPDIPPSLLRAIQLMEKKLAEPLNIDMLADAAGMSRYHFCRVFKKSIGVTPMTLVSRLRIERAKELLRRGKPVSLICMEVGYNDLSHFIRQFKRSVKCTPGAYRARTAGYGYRAGTSDRTLHT